MWLLLCGNCLLTSYVNFKLNVKLCIEANGNNYVTLSFLKVDE